MLLHGSDGVTKFGIRLVGYESPEIPDEGPDSTWLLVAIGVACATGSGTCVDPCLTVSEAEELIGWFEAIGDSDPALDKRGPIFIEPNLSLALVAETGDRVTVWVHYVLERQGRWANPGGKPVDGKHGGELQVEAPRAAVRKAADQMRQDLGRLPVRRWRHG